MDSLLALREAISSRQEIVMEGDHLVIGARRLALNDEVPIKAKSGGYLTLAAVYFSWKIPDIPSYIKLMSDRGLRAMVLITERKAILDFLSALSRGESLLDPDFRRREAERRGGAAAPVSADGSAGASAAPGAGAATPGTAGSSATSASDAAAHAGLGPSAAMREIVCRTRNNILEVLNKPTLAKEVFAFFSEKSDRPDAAEDDGDAERALKRSRGESARADAAREMTKRMTETMARAAGIVMEPRRTTPNIPPLIIVPAVDSSLINIFNVSAFLSEGRFVPTADAKAAWGVRPRPTVVEVEHVDARGVSVRYQVVESVSRFGVYDWGRVVAIFVLGQPWQFSGWRWGREPGRPDIAPVEIFDRTQAFHVHFDDEDVNPTVRAWKVTPLAINKTRRHTDPGAVNKFWKIVDNFIATRRTELLWDPTAEIHPGFATPGSRSRAVSPAGPPSAATGTGGATTPPASAAAGGGGGGGGVVGGYGARPLSR